MEKKKPQPEAHETLMTAGELANYLNVPLSWVYSHTRTAKRTGFPVFKVGKYCRFMRSKVLDWLNNDGQ